MAKVIKIWENLIRFGQNQSLASPKTINLLRLWAYLLFDTYQRYRFPYQTQPVFQGNDLDEIWFDYPKEVEIKC